MITRTAFCLMLTAMGAALGQTTTFPTWALPGAGGGTGPTEPFVAPMYHGPHGGVVAEYLLAYGKTMTCKGLVQLRSSPKSGVIAVIDARQHPRQKLGMDSGFAHILGSTLVGDAGVLPARALFVGWDVSTGRSSMRMMTIPPSGNLTMTVWGPTSSPGEIWTSPSIVDGALYVLDLATFGLVRFLDNDSDGVPETRDTSFVVSIPPKAVANDPTTSAAAWLHPIEKVGPPTFGGGPLSQNPLRSDGVVDLVPRFRNRREAAFIDRIGPNYVFIVADRQARIRLAILDSVVVGQRRVVVTGTPETTFSIWRNDGTAESEASKKATIPMSGAMIVDLLVAVNSGESLRAIASDGATASPARLIRSDDIAVLFRPLALDLEQGSLTTFDGDKLHSGLEGRARIDNDVVPVDTIFVNKRTIRMKVPVLGNPLAEPPYSRGRLIDLWLVHKADGTLASDPIQCWVRFD